MNGRTIARTGASLALIVLSTSSTASDCERRDEQARNDDRDSRGSSQVVIRADDDVCWKMTVDDRNHSGCGDATFYRHDSDRRAQVEKVDGDRDVKVTVVVNGKTVRSERVRSNGERVDCDDPSDSKDGSKDGRSGKERSSTRTSSDSKA